MQNDTLKEVENLMIDAEKIREEANELDKLARDTLKIAKEKHDEACELDKKAREKLEEAKKKHDEACDLVKRARRKLVEVPIFAKIENDENVNRGAGIEQNIQQLGVTNTSFQSIPVLIYWTKNQVKGHKFEVDFEGYVVRVNPRDQKKYYKI